MYKLSLVSTLALAAFVSASPLLLRSSSTCSSGGKFACCNRGTLLNCLLSTECSSGDVYCCQNENRQTGLINVNTGNCQRSALPVVGEVGGIVSGVTQSGGGGIGGALVGDVTGAVGGVTGGGAGGLTNTVGGLTGGVTGGGLTSTAGGLTGGLTNTAGGLTGSDSKQFNPETDIASLSGKVFFITGGTAGIGKTSILQLSKHQPAHIYFSGRDSRKAQAVIEEVQSQVPDAQITFIECDLASLQSVKKAANEFVSLSTRLDVLMCNAGVMALPPGLTKDGYEIQFGTNHLGHALLIKSLLPTLIQTAEQPNSDVRVIILSSDAYLTHPTGGIIFKDLRTTQDMAIFGAMTRYGQSKLANLLYAAELARRYPNITSVSIHPGIVRTELTRGASSAMQKLSGMWKMTSPEEGAHNQVWASTCEKSKLVNGAYYEPVGKLKEKCREGKNSQLAERLWDWTTAELKDY